MGRIDDVLNVAGHRLGTMEIESALVSHPRVAEAAVVGKPHDIKGESVFAYVVCRGLRPVGDTSALVAELRNWVAEELGAIARPDEIRFADNLPKTRSGKIMRRLLRSVARGEEILQDVSTLENPAILDQLRGAEDPTANGVARTAAKTTSRRKPAGKKTPAKKTPAKKTPAKKTPAKKTPAKRSATSRPASKKAARARAASAATRKKTATPRRPSVKKSSASPVRAKGGALSAGRIVGRRNTKEPSARRRAGRHRR